MALKSTIFKIQLALADIDHAFYDDFSLTLARHPSETDARMMVRLVAYALQAHAVQADCAGNGTLSFGAGLSNPDEPDLHVSDYTGRKRRWVEVGQPEDKPVARAASLADQVVVYAFAPQAEVWWRGIERKLARIERLSVYRIPADTVDALAMLTQRSLQLQATVQDGLLTLSGGESVVLVEPERWR
jgi:uncharacterized protein YaeQ